MVVKSYQRNWIPLAGLLLIIFLNIFRTCKLYDTGVDNPVSSILFVILK